MFSPVGANLPMQNGFNYSNMGLGLGHLGTAAQGPAGQSSGMSSRPAYSLVFDRISTEIGQ